jgi:hypothetical protein
MQDPINLAASMIQAAMNGTLLLQTTMSPNKALAAPVQATKKDLVPALA